MAKKAYFLPERDRRGKKAKGAAYAGRQVSGYDTARAADGNHKTHPIVDADGDSQDNCAVIEGISQRSRFISVADVPGIYRLLASLGRFPSVPEEYLDEFPGAIWEMDTDPDKMLSLILMYSIDSGRWETITLQDLQQVARDNGVVIANIPSVARGLANELGNQFVIMLRCQGDGRIYYSLSPEGASYILDYKSPAYRYLTRC